MYFRKATISDTTVIKKLWKEVFGDSDDYICCFITHFGIDNCYVCEIKHAVVAMAFALPTTLALGSSFIDQDLKYVYACATHPKFRVLGIMENLLATIYKDACHENIAGIFLHAANPSLANYYRKLGFEDFFYCEHTFFNNRNKQLNNRMDVKKIEEYLSITTITPEAYLKKRNQKLANSCYINWNKDFFQFLSENGTQFCEYDTTLFSFSAGENKIVVNEILGNASKEQISCLLFEHFSEFETVQIRSMGNEICNGQMKKCHSFENQPNIGWFAFAME